MDALDQDKYSVNFPDIPNVLGDTPLTQNDFSSANALIKSQVREELGGDPELPEHLKPYKEKIDHDAPRGSLSLHHDLLDKDIDDILSYIDQKGWSKNIISFSFSWNKFTSFPEKLVQFTNLEKLDLSNNYLGTLPTTINKLQKLKEFLLFRNNLDTLPLEISHIQSLKDLSIGYNQFQAFPDEIYSMLSLMRLDISGNLISSIPREIASLVNLEEMYCNENRIDFISPEIGSLRSLKVLDMSNNHLEIIPDSFWNLTKLTSLSLDNNILDSISPLISQLQDLKDLKLSNNILVGLPDTIGSLNNLKYLDLGHNTLLSLPNSLSNLTSLKELDICFNVILPPVISLPGDINKVTLDNNVSIASEFYYTHQLKAQWNNAMELNKLTGVRDLAMNFSNYDKIHLPIEQVGYERIAKYNPPLFIQLLEDSRAGHDRDNETGGIFSPDQIKKREDILSSLDANTLVNLLAYGRQELVSSFESTFYYVFHAWIAKDKNMDQLNNKSGNELRNVFGTVSQLLERYTHLNGFKDKNILLFMNTLDRNINVMLETYNSTTVMEYVLPILVYLDNTNPSVSGPLKKFFEKLVLAIKPYHIDSNNPYYHLTGLLFAQLEVHGIKTGLDLEEKKKYELPDISSIESLDTKQRDTKNPCMVRLFFDDNSDGIWSFQHRLYTLAGFGLPDKDTDIPGKKIEKNGIQYTLEKKGGIIYISVKNKQGIVAHIMANYPFSSVGYNDITSFMNEKGVNVSGFDIIMDRGHAGEEYIGLSAVSDNTDLIFIGSCGGYGHIAKTLEKNPHVQYIGTSGKGDTSVNDAYFCSIIDNIAHQQSIVRKDRKVNTLFIGEPQKYNEFVGSYQLPHKNIYIPFKKALVTLDRKE